MRFWFYLLILIFLLVGGVVAAQLYLETPIYIRYGDWSIQPPASVVLGLTLLVLLLCTIAFRLLMFLLLLPARMRKWEQERRLNKRRKALEDAVRFSLYRDRRALLKTLAAVSDSDPLMAWWAADVARELDDTAARKKWLERAANSKDKIIAAAAKAEISRHDNLLGEAAQTLKLAGAPQGAVLLAESYYAVSTARRDWQGALAAAVYLRDKAPTLWNDTVVSVVQRQLEAAKTAAAAAAFWQNHVSGEDRKRPELLAAYLTALWQLGDEKGAKDGVTKALKQFPRNDAILEVVTAVGDKTLSQTAFRENEQRAEQNNARSLLLLARLAEQSELPGKARRFYQMLNALEPHSRYQEAIAALTAKMGDA